MISTFFYPKTIAVIGATENPKKFGYQITLNLLKNPLTPKTDSEPPYKVFPVSLTGGQILGSKAYSSLQDIPDQIDLVLILVPTKGVLAVIQDCINKKVKSIIIVTAGFGEINEEGKKVEQEIATKCSKAGIRVIGPNCVGIENTENYLNASFIQFAHLGHISMISQSGSFGCAVIDGLWWNHLGIAKFANIGNQIDVDFGDILQYFNSDPETHVIALYLEALKNGTKFFSSLQHVTPQKPVIVFKGGRTSQGMAAAFSHTGSLASDFNIFKSAIHQAGAIFCHSMEEYLAALKAFSLLPLPKDSKIGVLSNSGGSGVLYSDSIAELNLPLAQFSETLQNAIQPHVIDLVKIQNPLDMIAGADEKQYYEITKAMLQPESGIDIVVPCGVYPPFLGLKFANNFRGVIKAWNETGRQKTLIPLFIYAQGYPEMVNLAKEQSVPYFTTPNEAAFATKSLLDYCNFLKVKNIKESM